MFIIQWIVLFNNHQWWSCFATTKEDCVEKFKKLFPNDKILAMYRLKDINPYDYWNYKE